MQGDGEKIIPANCQNPRQSRKAVYPAEVGTFRCLTQQFLVFV